MTELSNHAQRSSGLLTPLTRTRPQRAVAPALFKLRPLVLALAGACVAAAAQPAGSAIVSFTGNAPVYVVNDNGLFLEFQYLLDWQGYCNAHPTAVCGAPTFWGSAGNWSSNSQPAATDDVLTPAGSVVSINTYSSQYQGIIPGNAYAGSLTANGQISIGPNGALYTNSAYIEDLALGGGQVFNDGLITVNNLSSALGQLRGTGTTRINNASTAFFEPLIRDTQTVEFYGNWSGSGFGPRLNANTTFINFGTLNGGAPRLEGSANANTLPVFVNRGAITGGFSFDGVRFNNEGTVDLPAGGTLTARFNGTHTGSFTAAANTELIFGALGIAGHRFLPSSSISSDGRVIFEGCCHSVEGSYDAHETVARGQGDVAFRGSVSFLDTVLAGDGSPLSRVRFETPGGVAIGEVIANAGTVHFDAGAASTVGTFTLTSGGLIANSPLTVAGLFTWTEGTVAGTGLISANGGIEMNGASRSLAGNIRNGGTANWNAGSFSAWTGSFENAAGSLFDLKGDFSIASGGGRFDNAGKFIKSAGAGIATWPVAFNNSGEVEVQSGTLRLSGGGVHATSTFTALPGATIELSGGTTIAGNVITVGRVDVTGGSFSVLSAGSYTNAATNTVYVTDFSTQRGGSFTNNGGFASSGIVTNDGTLTNRGTFVASSFNNAGTASIAAGATVSVNNGGSNTGTIHNAGTVATTGVYLNSGSINNTGSWENAGTFDQQGSGFINNGLLGNTAGASFTVAAAGRVSGTGAINNDGSFFIDDNATVQAGGKYAQFDINAVTWVKGTLDAAGGIDIREGLLKGSGNIVGNVTLGQTARWTPYDSPGTQNVFGNVTVNGDATLAPGSGNIEIEIASGAIYDKLAVAGDVTLNDATLDFVFLPGYTPTDGESFQWLSTTLPQNSVSQNGQLTTHVSGLTDWTGTVIVDAAGARIEMTYDLATQIPLTGSLSIPAGAVAFNAISPSAGFTPALDQLDNAGTFSNRGGAYAQIFGLDNQAGASLLNSGQLWTTGTTVNSGLITNRVGAVFESTGMINRGTIDNQGRFTSYGGFVNEPDGRFENRGTYDNEGFAQINNSGEFIVSGRVNNNASTLGPAYYTGSIRNTGRFTVQPGGIVTGSGTYFQVSPDAVTRVDGTLSASDITILNGTLSGSGTLVGPVALGNANGLGAVVQPGNSPGTLTIDGNLTAYYTTFEIELAGLSSFDRLVVDGSASFFGSQVIFSLTEGGYAPSIGDSFTWLTASGGTSGLGTLAWSIYVTSPGGVSSWQPPSGMEVAFYGDRIEFTTAPIPEPSTWVTLLAGLGLLGFATRRRCF